MTSIACCAAATLRSRRIRPHRSRPARAMRRRAVCGFDNKLTSRAASCCVSFGGTGVPYSPWSIIRASHRRRCRPLVGRSHGLEQCDRKHSVAELSAKTSIAQSNRATSPRVPAKWTFGVIQVRSTAPRVEGRVSPSPITRNLTRGISSITMRAARRSVATDLPGQRSRSAANVHAMYPTLMPVPRANFFHPFGEEMSPIPANRSSAWSTPRHRGRDQGKLR